MTLQWPNNILLVRNSYVRSTTLNLKSMCLGGKKNPCWKKPKLNMKEKKKGKWNLLLEPLHWHLDGNVYHPLKPTKEIHTGERKE